MTGPVAELRTPVKNETLFVNTLDQTLVNTSGKIGLINTLSNIGSLTIPAKKLVKGARFTFVVQGLISSTTGNPPFTFEITLGSLVMANTGAVPLGNTDNDHWILSFDFVVRDEGVTGSVMGSGGVLTAKNDHFSLVNTANLELDTTVDALLRLTGQWTTGSALNSITTQIASLTQQNV